MGGVPGTPPFGPLVCTEHGKSSCSQRPDLILESLNMPACAQAGGTRGDPCGGVVFCGGGVLGFLRLCLYRHVHVHVLEGCYTGRFDDKAGLRGGAVPL